MAAFTVDVSQCSMCTYAPRLSSFHSILRSAFREVYFPQVLQGPIRSFSVAVGALCRAALAECCTTCWTFNESHMSQHCISTLEGEIWAFPITKQDLASDSKHKITLEELKTFHVCYSYFSHWNCEPGIVLLNMYSMANVLGYIQEWVFTWDKDKELYNFSKCLFYFN